MLACRISAVVPTRNRGASVARTVQSILDGDFREIELILADQSDSDETEIAVSTFLKDPRFRYIRSGTRGTSTCRNVGTQHASAPIVANTDDDCEAAPDWLSRVMQAFETRPDIAIVLGNVLAGPHPAEGFVLGFTVKQPELIRGVSRKHRAEGMGACFAYRTAVWRELHGFDELLGTGARYQSAEEVDFMIRALARGYAIYQSPEVTVTHHGFRTWKEANAVLENYLYGIGAVSSKHLRLHPGPYSCVLARLAARWMLESPVADFGFKPPRFPRLHGFLRGFGAGWAHAVDDAGHFVRE